MEFLKYLQIIANFLQATRANKAKNKNFDQQQLRDIRNVRLKETAKLFKEFESVYLTAQDYIDETIYEKSKAIYHSDNITKVSPAFRFEVMQLEKCKTSLRQLKTIQSDISGTIMDQDLTFTITNMVMNNLILDVGHALTNHLSQDKKIIDSDVKRFHEVKRDFFDKSMSKIYPKS